MYGGSAVPQGGVGDRHLATVPKGVVGNRLSWGGEGQGGGGRVWAMRPPEAKVFGCILAPTRDSLGGNWGRHQQPLERPREGNSTTQPPGEGASDKGEGPGTDTRILKTARPVSAAACQDWSPHGLLKTRRWQGFSAVSQAALPATGRWQHGRASDDNTWSLFVGPCVVPHLANLA